jgi:hypothetical protein
MTIRCCLLAVLLAGCAGPMATATGPSSPASASDDPRTAGPAASAGATVPPSVPPLPDGFPIHGSMEPREAGQGSTAAWSSDAEPPAIYDFYLDALEAAGYVIDLAAPGGAAAIVRFHAADGTPYQLTLTGSGPITVELGPPRP